MITNRNPAIILFSSTATYWSPALLGFFSLYLPVYYELSQTLWASEEQGHGPLILAISAFLIWQKKYYLQLATISQSDKLIGVLLVIFGTLFYLSGRVLEIRLFEIGSQIFILSSIFIFASGVKNLRNLWFPLFFLVFMIPLPIDVVNAITLPMKIAVSIVAENILYWLDYPIARSGVIIQIGVYKLLVADACAGLHTVFTLEAMGLLYLHLIKRDSLYRNISLAILIVPISFISNSLRVITLILITYYFGDEVGQGFIHGFAGMFLFGVALVLIIFVDSGIHVIEKLVKKRTSKL